MKTAPAILPKNLKILKDLGEHIQLARLRRQLSADQIAERTGLGRKTIYNIEQGSPTVAIGSYLQVLFVLGLEKISPKLQPLILWEENCKMLAL